ncbi:unnamed protein product [Penicillium salamii]|uniref:FAD-binding PCMH-type domain-containing protein n=1 Tax=Penicillium salamii TaxID=1612424 RepID=A0A9W4JLG9_9EURO|nr:unnamed protein product [Penicillium salamii]CAG8373493.1 unnamed protein product [Penicillium salamii]CAG8391638.1 unnamed protein product [Penicillium salamii]CAG8407130.1 unnamed protein product [Penicillium salamii]
MSDTKLPALESFLQNFPTIKYISPVSPEYPTARKVFKSDRPDNPLAIVQPQSPSDLCALIKYAKSQSLQFTIRCGGHNLEGRVLVEGALLIDIRALNAVTIAPDRQTATVQGGILQEELGNKLWAEGLATPIGSIPSVGYVGWATYGGYGPFSGHWGLGVDQILGATIINHDGEILKAEESILRGIRGAGGLFGVILDLTIKVYPMTSLLAGPIIFDSTDIIKSVVNFNKAYSELQRSEELPPQLTIQQIAFNSPHGRTHGVIFVWSGSDIEEGQRWSDKIASIHPVVANAVAVTTIPKWFAGTAALVPPTGSGAAYSVNAFEISPAIAESIGRSLDQMPSDPGTMLSIHQLRGQSTTAGSGGLPSVFETRTPHYMLELIGFSTVDATADTSRAWARRTEQEVKQADPRSVLSTVYVSLFNTTGLSSAEVLEKTYGSTTQTLKDLKATFDPENVFSLAVPSLH